jgi:hypothetical protein
MSKLALPSQMQAIIDYEKHYTVYLLGDNPQRDGTIAYGSKDRKVLIYINPSNMAVWP